MTALVGRNGAGKSCFLHALRLFYAVNPTVTNEDYYNKQTGDPIHIRVTFTSLLPQEVEAFSSYMDGNDLIVTKKITYADGKVIAKTYGASRQHPEFADVRGLDGAKAKITKYKELADSGRFTGLEAARSQDAVEEQMAAWEAANPGTCQAIDREHQFIGPASIGVGLLDSFTKFVFIPAVRDVADEASEGKGSALTALLDLVVNERVETRPALQDLREYIRDNYAAIFATGNQPELGKLAEEISAVLGDFHPGAAVELGWRAGTPPEIRLPSVDPTLIEDGFKGDVSRKGHGLQRALVLALLQARAKTIAASPSAPRIPPAVAPMAAVSPAAAQPAVPAAPALPPRRRLILAIEEPELYQHPQQCRHWAKVLRRITTPPAGQTEPDTQVIFTTHSPHFVDLSWFDQVRLVLKHPGAAAAPPIAKTRSTTLDEIAKELAIATGKPKTEFTARSTLARARPVMTNLVNEGFFASVAVLVEGGTEVGLLQEVARRKEKDWDAKGIAVIDVGGKTKLSTPLAVFRKMGIPVYVVFDSDVHDREKGNQAEKDERSRQNRLLLKLLTATEEDYPAECNHPKYSVVGEETSRHLKESLGATEYDRIAKQVANDLGYDGSKAAMKNVEACALFAERVYEEGKELLLFESIVDHVTALAPKLTTTATTP